MHHFTISPFHHVTKPRKSFDSADSARQTRAIGTFSQALANSFQNEDKFAWILQYDLIRVWGDLSLESLTLFRADFDDQITRTTPASEISSWACHSYPVTLLLDINVTSKYNTRIGYKWPSAAISRCTLPLGGEVVTDSTFPVASGVNNSHCRCFLVHSHVFTLKEGKNIVLDDKVVVVLLACFLAFLFSLSSLFPLPSSQPGSYCIVYIVSLVPLYHSSWLFLPQLKPSAST